MLTREWSLTAIAVSCLFFALTMQAQPTDPGVRGGAAGAGGAIAGLTVQETKFFNAGLDDFKSGAIRHGIDNRNWPRAGPAVQHG